MTYANNKGADQLAHPHSLISAFVVRCMDSIIHVLAIAEISRLWLLSVAKQAGLSLTWSQTTEGRFSRDEAHMAMICSQIERLYSRLIRSCRRRHVKSPLLGSLPLDPERNQRGFYFLKWGSSFVSMFLNCGYNLDYNNQEMNDIKIL